MDALDRWASCQGLTFEKGRQFAETRKLESIDTFCKPGFDRAQRQCYEQCGDRAEHVVQAHKAALKQPHGAWDTDECAGTITSEVRILDGKISTSAALCFHARQLQDCGTDGTGHIVTPAAKYQTCGDVHMIEVPTENPELQQVFFSKNGSCRPSVQDCLDWYAFADKKAWKSAPGGTRLCKVGTATVEVDLLAHLAHGVYKWDGWQTVEATQTVKLIMDRRGKERSECCCEYEHALTGLASYGLFRRGMAQFIVALPRNMM